MTSQMSEQHARQDRDSRKLRTPLESRDALERSLGDENDRRLAVSAQDGDSGTPSRRRKLIQWRPKRVPFASAHRQAAVTQLPHVRASKPLMLNRTRATTRLDH